MIHKWIGKNKKIYISRLSEFWILLVTTKTFIYILLLILFSKRYLFEIPKKKQAKREILFKQYVGRKDQSIIVSH